MQSSGRVEMKKFDYMEFWDGYGTVFCAKTYTAEEAREITAKERYEDIENIGEPEKVFVRFTVNGGDVFENQPCYVTCGSGERGAFPCWRIE